MPCCNISGNFRRAAFAFAAVIAVAFFLCAPPAWAAHRRHGRSFKTHNARSSRTRPAAAHVTTRHPKSTQARAPRSARAHHTSVARRSTKPTALEVDRRTVTTEFALRPRESFRALPPLRGSRESLLRQNQRADEEGLQRVANDEMLDAMMQNGTLVPLPASVRLTVDPRLESDRRYCRPWAARFLTDLSRVFYTRFGSPLKVDSAVRTVQYQRHLLLVNGNAAPADGEIRSPHLTGEAVDISKKGLSPTQISWLRSYLLPLQSDGTLDVEEEFHQACFHISIYESYRPAGGVLSVASVPQASAHAMVHTQARAHAPASSRRSRRRRTTPLLATRLP